ncbi:DNA replication/repair protein RecF [Dysosmobacter sp. HCP28S3_G4]|uniref:DNA replication/repair protein RecF n=1 Tax=Dysosmobacter sp. HCP28S3_G4 TaxID=3438938 RepID=UPI003F887351
MRVNELTLRDFRNYQEQTVSFDPRCNVIFGENAEGKTNLLEAVVYLACGKSPRARRDQELIRFEADSASLTGNVFSRERDFQIRADLFRGRRRKLTVNGVAAKSAAALNQVYQTVFFCPDDLYLIREGAAARRKFMDTALCQLRPRYAAALAEYNRAYEHKTRILRDWEEHPALLDTLPEFNEQMIRYGAVLIHYRAQYARRLAEYAAANHLECSGGRERLDIAYQTVSAVTDPMAEQGQVAEQLRSHMNAHAEAERASRLCLSGPHKDDLLVRINDQEAKTYSSQGQTRTAALSMKLAEREILKNTSGEYPVLLLDDVLSELDPRRQEFVLNRIAGGQVFITCCEDDRLPQLLGGKVFHVKQGAIG